MPHYIYLNHTSDDYDANRKGMMSEKQLQQLHATLFENTLKQRKVFFLIGVGICVTLLLIGSTILALALVLFLIQASLMYPYLIRYRLDKLQTLMPEHIEGKIRLMNQEVRTSNDPLFIQLRHHEIDLNFDVSADKLNNFNETDTYRFYYTESPHFILSAQAVDTLSETNYERETYETL